MKLHLQVTDSGGITRGGPRDLNLLVDSMQLDDYYSESEPNEKDSSLRNDSEEDGDYVKCPNGHRCYLLETPQEEYLCRGGSCRETPTKDFNLYTCPDCDFDICPTCAHKQPDENSSDEEE